MYFDYLPIIQSSMAPLTRYWQCVIACYNARAWGPGWSNVTALCITQVTATRTTTTRRTGDYGLKFRQADHNVEVAALFRWPLRQVSLYKLLNIMCSIIIQRMLNYRNTTGQDAIGLQHAATFHQCKETHLFLQTQRSFSEQTSSADGSPTLQP